MKIGVKKYWTITLSMLFVIVPLFLFNCDTVEPEPKEIEIQVPELDEKYENYNPIECIVKYNYKKTSLPGWNFSTNGGKDWSPMTIDSVRTYQTRYDDFTFDVVIWVPKHDKVENTEVYIKVTSYDNQKKFDIVGPIEIQ